MERKNKQVFWEALIIAIFIFGSGMFFGYFLEMNRVSQISYNLIDMETSLSDLQLSFGISDLTNLSCDFLLKQNQQLSDNIYQKALMVDRYESSSVLSQERILLEHKRIDILRTSLWLNTLKIQQRCSDKINTAVYLYEYPAKDLGVKAKQNTFSKALVELKHKEGDDLVLISIASNLNITTLDFFIKKYNITSNPAIIINGRVLYDLEQIPKLGDYLYED